MHFLFCNKGGFLATLIAIYSLVTIPTTLAYPVRRWTYAESEGDTNYDFGKAFGLKFRNEIKIRLASDKSLSKLVEEFGGGNNAIYQHFLSTHMKAFPEYMDELKGVAVGSGITFNKLFIDQLKEEFTYFKANQTDSKIDLKLMHHCSDVILWQKTGNIYMAHNEDSASFDVNGTVLVEAVNGVNGKPGFTTLTYMGNTPTGAFGFNTEGVVFTMNYLAPLKADLNGLGRVFIARKMLDSSGFDDAVNIATKSPMIAGHNYQIGLINSKNIVNVEVASFGIYKVTTFKAGDPAFFHANKYVQMHNQPQQLPRTSSDHRMARFKEIEKATPIVKPDEMLMVLGDQKDRQYPIYHDDLSNSRGDLGGFTLVSVFVDLQEGVMSVFAENPKFNKPTFNLTIC
jgi:hypothetical protein